MLLSAYKNIIDVDDCAKILQNYDSTAKYVKHNICSLSEQPLGFLGEHFSLKIAFENGKSTGSAEFFVKTLPESNANQCEYVQSTGVFKKELLFYKNILSKLLPLSGRKFAPHAFLVKPDKCIVLENLLTQGFSVSCCEHFDQEHCVSTLQSLARFHAATVIYEENYCINGQTQCMFDYYPEELMETTFVLTKGHPRQQWIETTSKAVIDCIKMMPEYSSRSEVVNKLYEIIKESIKDFVKPSKKYRNVITHADLWRNNLMFRRKNEELECVIVDFQLARYSPPAFDVLTALYMNTERSFLNDHMNEFLNMYHAMFTSELKRHDLETETLFPKNTFLESVKEYKLPALIQAAFYGTNVYIRDELCKKIVSDEKTFREFAFIDRSKYVCKEFQEDEKFRRRICNVIHPFVETAMQTVN